MSYVPEYLLYKDRQTDGWPKGITENGKSWAVEKATMLLDCYRFLPMEIVRIILFEAPDRPDDFKDKPLLDYQYAVADRALRAASGCQVWVPHQVQNRRRFRFLWNHQVTDSLTPDQAKNQVKSFDNYLRKEFGDWVDRAQIGEMFLLREYVTVFCCDQSHNPQSLTNEFKMRPYS